jgi:hypothetical protein
VSRDLAIRRKRPFLQPAFPSLSDLGPHAVSLMWAIFGPVESVTADVGCGDLAHLVLHHLSGATSTATATLSAPDAAMGFDLENWGEQGRSSIPPLADDPVVALRVALSELAANSRSGNLCTRAMPGSGEMSCVVQAQTSLDAS